MKNIFKLMGMALIAGSLMFVACNKDEEEENNNNNGGNNGGTTTTASYKITFNGNTWEPAYTGVAPNSNQPWAAIMAIKEQSDVEAFQAFIGQYGVQYFEYAPDYANMTGTSVCGYFATETGTFTYAESENYMTLNDPTVYEYDGEDIILGEDTITAGRYYQYNSLARTYTETINTIDLNAQTVSGNWDEDVATFEEMLANNFQSYGNLLKMSGEFKNFKWTVME